MIQFSKFFCVVRACEKCHLFLFHRQLPIVHRLAARRRQSDKGLSRQFFRAKNQKGEKTLTLRWSQNPRDLTYMDELLILIVQSMYNLMINNFATIEFCLRGL